MSPATESLGSGMSDCSNINPDYGYVQTALANEENDVFDTQDEEYEPESKKLTTVVLKPLKGDSGSQRKMNDYVAEAAAFNKKTHSKDSVNFSKDEDSEFVTGQNKSEPAAYIREEEITKMGYKTETNTEVFKGARSKDGLGYTGPKLQKDGNVFFSGKNYPEDTFQNLVVVYNKNNKESQPTDPPYIPHQLVNNDKFLKDAVCSDPAKVGHLPELESQRDNENVLNDGVSSHPSVHIKSTHRPVSEKSDSGDSGICSPSVNGVSSHQYKNVKFKKVENHASSSK